MHIRHITHLPLSDKIDKISRLLAVRLIFSGDDKYVRVGDITSQVWDGAVNGDRRQLVQMVAIRDGYDVVAVGRAKYVLDVTWDGKVPGILRGDD